MQKQTEHGNYEAFESQVFEQFGLLMGSNELARALSFTSLASFRQACRRGKIPIPMFKIEGRAGRFAISTDVAKWLWKLRSENLDTAKDFGKTNT